MFRRFMNKSASVAAALLFSCSLLFSTAQAQEFDDEAYSGLSEEGHNGESWYYDAYEVLSAFAPNWLFGVGCETVTPSRGE
jgi:hypothetical protein